MRSIKSLAFGAFALSLGSIPAFAATLDMSRAHVVARFEEFNLTTNLIAQNGQLLIPDSQRDVLMISSLRDETRFEIPLSVRMANFIVALDGNRVAVSDPANDQIAIVDLAARREVSSHTYTDHFGPWHMAYYEGVIYGSNKFDQLIVRYNPNTRRQLGDYQGGSGPSFLTAHHGLLFVGEQGGLGSPGDDHVAWYDLSTGELAGRTLLEGSMNELVAWDSGVCMTLSYANKVQCGYPEKDEWLEAETENHPWGITIGERQIWVLSRGEDGDIPTIITYGLQNGALVRLAAWKLRGIADLENPRSLAFDAETRTLLVRGNRSVLAIPVINWE